MQNYDIAMIALLGFTTLMGFARGFARQLAGILSLVLSYFAALRFSDALAPHLNADPKYAKYLAMLILYCGTAFVVWMVFRFVSGGIDQIRLREFDRQVGGLLGFGKGVLLCTVVTFFAVTLNADSRAAVLKSKSGYYISDFLHKAKPIMPPQLSEYLKPYLDKLERGLDPNQAVEHPTLPKLPSMPNIQNGLPAGISTEQQMQQQLRQLQGQLPQSWLQQLPQNGGYPTNQPGYGQPIYGPSGYNPPAIGGGYQTGYGPQNPGPYAPPQNTQPGGYSSGFGS